MKNQQTVYYFPCEKLIQKDEDIREKHKKRDGEEEEGQMVVSPIYQGSCLMACPTPS